MTEPENHPSIGPDPTTCPVCPHRRADHDAIADRYCSASVARGSAHGCVCRPTG